MSVPVTVAVPTCPACSARGRKQLLEVHHFATDDMFGWGSRHGYPGATLYGCRTCGLAYKDPQPSPGFLEEHYGTSGEEYVENIDEAGAVRADLVLGAEVLVDRFPDGARVLDVGCASGGFLDRLPTTWERSGVEMSAHAAEQARTKGHGVVTGHLADARHPDESFDVVTMFDVMEHLPEPRVVLGEIHRILRPGGTLMIGTGDIGAVTARLAGARWAYLAIPDHICFYDRGSMAEVLSHAGFTVSSAQRFQHGSSGPSVARGWRRSIIKHWSVRLLGLRVLRAPVFNDRSEDFVVQFHNDHRLWVATRDADHGEEQQ